MPTIQPEDTPRPVGYGSQVFDWSTVERVQAVPDHIWPGLSSAKGLGRMFVGRRGELALLMQRHSRAPETVDSAMPPDEASFITEVTNAPGVGKSALLEKMEEEHIASGGHSLKLAASDLRDKDTLREALLESEPAQQAAMLRDAKVLKHLTKALEITGDAQTGFASTVFEWVVKAGERLGRNVPEKPGTEAHAKMVRILAERAANLDAMGMLSLMGQGANGRLLLVVDEAQELGEMTDGKTAKLLQQLGDPSQRTTLGLQSGGLLLAGLPDAIQRLRELHKSRAYNMHLAPLPAADVEILLQRAFRQGDPKGALNDHQVQSMARALTVDFGQWTHHAHSAAFAAAWVVRNAMRHGPRFGPPDPDQLMDWIRTNAALGTCLLYDQTAELARGIIGTDGVLQAAEAMQQFGTVSGDLLHRAMDQQRARKAGNPIEDMSNRQGLQALLHSGLVGRVRNPEGGATDELVIPIPTLTDYLIVGKGQARRQNAAQRQPTTPPLTMTDAAGSEPSWFDD